MEWKGVVVSLGIGLVFGTLAGWIAPSFNYPYTTQLHKYVIFSILPSVQMITLTLLLSEKNQSSWEKINKRLAFFFISFLFFTYGYPIYDFVDRPQYHFKDHLIMPLIFILSFLYSVLFVISLDRAAILVTLLSLGSSYVAAYLASRDVVDVRKRKTLVYLIIVEALIMALSSIGMPALGA